VLNNHAQTCNVSSSLQNKQINDKNKEKTDLTKRLKNKALIFISTNDVFLGFDTFTSFLLQFYFIFTSIMVFLITFEKKMI